MRWHACGMQRPLSPDSERTTHVSGNESTLSHLAYPETPTACMAELRLGSKWAMRRARSQMRKRHSVYSQGGHVGCARATCVALCDAWSVLNVICQSVP